MEPDAKLDPITETALRSLKEIAIPQPISWMPQTWGWAVLAVILVGAILLGALLLYRRWRKNAYRREALRLLAQIAVDFRNAQTREATVARLGELLKRTALAAWPREMTAAMSGAEWVNFIRSHQSSQFGRALDDYLNDGEYRSTAALNADTANELISDTRRWIERHHVSA